jgi:uncharacterized protein
MDKSQIILATATPGGGFPLYGDTVAEIVNAVDPSLAVVTRNTRGSTENVPLLETGGVDLGLVQGEVTGAALGGPDGTGSGLTVVAAMYATAGMFAVRGDAPYRTIADLRDRPVVFGARGSGLVVLARHVLDGLGLDAERDFTALYLDHAGDGPAMVLDGRAVALWGGGIGWPGFTAIAASPAGARFIAPDAVESARIRERHAFLKPLTIPALSYPGQDAAIASLGSWSLILARPGLPEDVGYRFARALDRGGTALAERLPQARETTPDNTAAAAADPGQIHPGTARYLREIGVLSEE